MNAALYALAAGFLLFPHAMRDIPTALVGLAAALIRSLADLFGRAFCGLVSWLRAVELPPPLRAVIGLILLALSVPIAWTDYQVVRRSITLIWPDDLSPEWAALSVVLVTISVGLLLHSVSRRAARIPLLFLAIA